MPLFALHFTTVWKSTWFETCWGSWSAFTSYFNWALKLYHVVNWSGLNLRLAIDNRWTVGELNYSTVQLHDDFADGGYVVDRLASHLDVEIFVGVLTLGSQDMVTGRGQLEEISIKGLPVIVSPSCAHSADVRGISCNNINELFKHLFLLKWRVEQKSVWSICTVTWIQVQCV